MSSHPTDFQGSVTDALREAIEGAADLPILRGLQPTAAGGHFSIEVTSPVFAGISMPIESQRLVYSGNPRLSLDDGVTRPRGARRRQSENSNARCVLSRISSKPASTGNRTRAM